MRKITATKYGVETLYLSIMEAAEKTGVIPTWISKVLSKGGTAKGYSFSYASESNKNERKNYYEINKARKEELELIRTITLLLTPLGPERRSLILKRLNKGYWAQY